MTLEEIVKIIGLKNTIALARVIKALSNVLRNKDFLMIIKAMQQEEQ